MRLRNLVSYIWFILMFVGSSFGIFYVITGENIITGQKREVKDVLNASDAKNNSLGEKVSSNDKKEKDVEVNNQKTEEINTEVLKFNEVMAKTSNNLSFTLKPKTGESTANVIFRFGKEEKTQYVAVYASGLVENKRHFAWMLKGNESLKIGELKKIDDSNVLKLAKTYTQEDLQSYEKAYITTEEDEKSEDLVGNKVVFLLDLDFKKASTSPSAETTPTPTTAPTKNP